ncbi:hypothetical protein M4I32_01260 [Microbacterium sp. LRZ72]|uniref:hypothetical protein n=1 Tax=Microbacterium sp. LRZ72 TaxID=2942481 RepID=UPI0029BBC634|nr:hypothetical protein [Microbacterium sp. LRZ72]MDX2375429.1 hypothetical protein [Microbacterium sp. LRZ72]
MHRITYAGDWFVTGSAIAHALLDYAQALSQAEASATIEVPTREADGSIGRSEVLIGPASQLAAHEEDMDGDEVIDEALTERMHRKAERLRHYGMPSPTIGADPSGGTEGWNEYDDF